MPRHFPLLFCLARIDPDRVFQPQIVPADPASKSRKIVSVERGQRLFRIALRGAECSVRLSLEHHHEIRPYAPGRERVAKPLRYGTEVLADYDTSCLATLLPDHT